MTDFGLLRFVNSLLFLDQVGAYETWVLVAVFSSIALLVGGVVSYGIDIARATNI